MTTKLTKNQVKIILKRYKGTWKSVLELSYDYRVSQNVISYIVNHKKFREKTIAVCKKWRETHRDYMSKYHRVYNKKHKKELVAKARIRYLELRPTMRKIWAERARLRYQRLKK